MTMELIFPKKVLQNFMLTMKTGRAYPKKMEMAYGTLMLRHSRDYRKESVLPNEIFEFKQEYHASRSNPKFSRAISLPLKLTLKKKNQGPFMFLRTNGQMARINSSTFLGTEMLPNQILQERSQSFLKGR